MAGQILLSPLESDVVRQDRMQERNETNRINRYKRSQKSPIEVNTIPNGIRAANFGNKDKLLTSRSP